VSQNSDPSEGLREYYDGDYYDAVGFTGMMGREGEYESRARFAAHVRRDIPPEVKVFEFGCGLGYNLIRLPNAVKEGFDISSQAVEFCRAKGLTMYDRIEEVPRGRYDVIVCSHVLEHLTDPIGALGLFRELLTPGGTVDLVIPVEKYHKIPRSKKPNVDQHLFTWAPINIINLLAYCVFTVEGMCYVPVFARVMVWRLLGRFPGFASLLLKALGFLRPGPLRERPRAAVELRVLARKK